MTHHSSHHLPSLATVLLLLLGCNGPAENAVALEYARQAITQGGVTSSVTIDDDWGNGFCGAVTIVNKSPRQVRSWQLELNRQGYDLGRQWNGLRATSDARFVVFPANHNEQIPVGGTITVPFCGTGAGRPALQSMQVDTADGQS